MKGDIAAVTKRKKDGGLRVVSNNATIDHEREMRGPQDVSKQGDEGMLSSSVHDWGSTPRAHVARPMTDSDTRNSPIVKMHRFLKHQPNLVTGMYKFSKLLLVLLWIPRRLRARTELIIYSLKL